MKKISAAIGGIILFQGLIWAILAAGLMLYAFWDELGDLALHAYDKYHVRSVDNLKTDLHADAKAFYVLQHKENKGT